MTVLEAQQVEVPRKLAVPRRIQVRALVLPAVLACFFALLVYVNCYWSRYPNDNDLDEVGWLAANLDLSRPESFANQGYPPGLPVLLRLLTPLVGSLLTATFLLQSIAATVSVFCVHRITRQLTGHAGAGYLAMGCAMLAGAVMFTSEFADGTCTALFLSGLVVLLRREADRRGYVYFGLAAGGAYLFRTHYSMMIVLVPAALLLSGQGWRTAARSALAFAGGFACAAWPLWVLNILAYGTPLHAGVSQYNIAASVIPSAFDWENYPATYNLWPISRVLQERLPDFLSSMWRVGMNTIGSKLMLAGLGLGALAMTRTADRLRRQLLAALAILSVLYVGVVIVPTRHTERAFLPVGMLCSVLVGAGLHEIVKAATRRRIALVAAALGIVLLTYPINLYKTLSDRAHDARWNGRIVRRMVAAGMRSSDEVFSNVWAFYNTADPLFVSFYNYGGWIELDSKWASERPHPTARNVREWQAFFAREGIRFAILRNRRDASVLFRKTPPTWKTIFSDTTLTVWDVAPPAEPTTAELPPVEPRPTDQPVVRVQPTPSDR
ncbi:MAG: hypothetical protein RL685_5618 [Pseudomonadota bacterium]|jgi:hypothetical protein